MVFLIIAIGVFEMAYKKDDDDLAIQGIEILVLSAYTLTSQHITKKYNFDLNTRAEEMPLEVFINLTNDLF